MARVRRLAVDGLAALGRGCRRWLRARPGSASVSTSISSAGCGSSTTIDRPPPRSACGSLPGADPQSRFRIASAAISK